MNRDNIILIGMPAVGKSTVGVILAKILGYSFVDSDLLIQQREGRLLHEIIEQDGVDGFIAVENDVNCNIEAHHTVIATGGSAVYGREAMEHFKAIGCIVYLKIDYKVLERRLSDINGRGVVRRAGETLRELYDERTVLYEKYADIIVDEGSADIEKTVNVICRRLEDIGD